jgi:hypothetical protein
MIEAQGDCLGKSESVKGEIEELKLERASAANDELN